MSRLLIRPLALGLMGLLAACSNQPPVTTNPYVATSLTRVETLALAPGGGGLAAAVRDRLQARHDFRVLPADTLEQLMNEQGVHTLESAYLDGLSFLSTTSIDAVLVVRDGAGRGGNAMATVMRVPDGALIAQSRFTPRFITQDIRGEIADLRLMPDGIAQSVGRENDQHMASLLAADLAEALNR